MKSRHLAKAATWRIVASIVTVARKNLVQLY